MRKNEQMEINKLCVEMYNDLRNCIVWHGRFKVGRLRSCTAEVYETEGYYYLVSYDTIVACITKYNRTCYDFLRYVYGYTNTSAMHISKFCRDYDATNKLTYYPV